MEARPLCEEVVRVCVMGIEGCVSNRPALGTTLPLLPVMVSAVRAAVVLAVLFALAHAAEPIAEHPASLAGTKPNFVILFVDGKLQVHNTHTHRHTLTLPGRSRDEPGCDARDRVWIHG
jgi:hypothetical protein